MRARVPSSMAAATAAAVAAAAAPVLAGACGADGPPPARRAAAPGASPAAGPGDAVVATVNGRPVWASCVAAQAARGPGGRRAALDPGGPRAALDPGGPRAALDECVAFELLAQAAEARGLAGAPEAVEAARAAEVSRLVELDFEARYRGPADLQAAVDRAAARFDAQLDQPELRASAFARVEVPAGAPPEADAAARALAERIAGALAGETGLFPIHLREAADRLAAGAGQRVTHGDFRAATREALVPPYAAALFSIPEVGRIAPPARTAWGWDVVLLTQRIEAAVHTRAEVVAKLFPDVRRQQFYRWVNELAARGGVRVELDPARVTRILESASETKGASADTAAPPDAPPAPRRAPPAPSPAGADGPARRAP